MRSVLRSREDREIRWALFAGLAALLSVVCDGWSGKPSLLVHQILLLPADVAYVVVLACVLRVGKRQPIRCFSAEREMPSWWWIPICGFEAGAVCLIGAEAKHFRGFGYHLTGPALFCALAIVSGGWLTYLRTRTSVGLFAAVLLSYLAGIMVALRDFPLNYLRSDMLPVISWADQRMIAGLNPYGTIHMGTRLYDFPYLPGLLVAYWPAAALRLDLRLVGFIYLLSAAFLIWWSALPTRRVEVAASLGLFLLCPFLQYRHELYLQPHWFLLVLAVVLMQRRKFLWSAFAWGLGCAVYQFSWVLLPFFLLNGYRRRGLLECARLSIAACAGVLILAGPFLSSAWKRIGSNTVGQWNRLPHALADPINVSYWLTYVVRPDQLKWIQAVVLVVLFLYCCWRAGCADLGDTLRYMCLALGLFIPLNVIVDGYFYLTLLLLLLMYVCVANGWWREPRDTVQGGRRSMWYGSAAANPVV